jgi:SAM-dependent methyltransferase
MVEMNSPSKSISRPVWSGAFFLSPDAADRYRLKSNVAIFQEGDLDDEGRISQLDQMVARASVIGCLPAVAETYGPDSRMINYITDQSRHSYVSLLPINRDAVVLEIGCALGQCTALLADKAKEVVAMDVVRGQAEFALLRCKELGLTNIHVAVAGDDGRLPYNDCSFDVVVFNLVFEWCGSRSPEGNEVVQKRLLKEIARVLKHGGIAWISTKNRYSIRLLLGGRDEHMDDMRFGSCLPRAVGDRLHRWRGHQRSRGLLHSHTALRSLIRESGFSVVKAYWAVPEPRYVSHFVEANAESIQRFRQVFSGKQGQGRLVSRLTSLVPAKIVRYIAPGNCFVATKGA